VIGRSGEQQIGRSSDRENAALVHPISGTPDHPMGGLLFARPPDHPITRWAVSCSPDHRITRSPDGRALVHPISGSPDHLIGGLLVTRSPDHPITRLARSPQCVACFVVVFLLLGCAERVNPALCSFRPSPPWGRGWTAAGVFSSRGGPGEGVATLRPSVCISRAGSAFGNGSTDLLEEYVRRFESSYHAVQTIRADFTQTYVSGGRTRIESGVVYFARGGLMRWDYQRPQPKLFLSDGKTLMLYIPEEKQLTRSPLKASDDIRIPFRLLLSRLNLRRVFSRIQFAPDALEHDTADRVLRAYPKKGYEGDYHQVLMVVNPQFDIRRLLVILPDQSTMEFSFDHIGRNVPVSRSLFRFIPPAGTEVIDQH